MPNPCALCWNGHCNTRSAITNHKYLHSDNSRGALAQICLQTEDTAQWPSLSPQENVAYLYLQCHNWVLTSSSPSFPSSIFQESKITTQAFTNCFTHIRHSPSCSVSHPPKYSTPSSVYSRQWRQRQVNMPAPSASN